MAGAAPWLALGAGILGGVTRSAGHSAQAGVYRQSAETEDINAALAKLRGQRNSATVIASAQEKIASTKRAADEYLANQDADFAASGVVSGTGSAADVRDAQLRVFHHDFATIWQNAQMQAADIEWSAGIDSWNSSAQASRYRFLADAEDSASTTSLLGGVLEGAGDYFDMA